MVKRNSVNSEKNQQKKMKLELLENQSADVSRISTEVVDTPPTDMIAQAQKDVPSYTPPNAFELPPTDAPHIHR